MIYVYVVFVVMDTAKEIEFYNIYSESLTILLFGIFNYTVKDDILLENTIPISNFANSL